MSNGETVEFTWRLAESLWRDGNYPGARRELRRVDADHPGLSADVVIGTGVMLNIIEQSSEDYRQAVKALKDTESLVTVCRCPMLTGKWCNSFAATYRAMGDYEPALPLYEEAIRQFTRGGAYDLAARSRNNVGNLFLSLGQPDIARPYVEQAIRDCEDEITLAQFKATEARLLCAEGDYERAEEVASESAEFLQAMNEPTFAAESLKTLGQITLALRKVRTKR